MYWLDSPLKRLKMKTEDPYNEIVAIFRQINKVENSFIAWIYTDVLGYDVIYCEYNGNEDCYEWATDWYEGGDCYLLYIAALDDVEPLITQQWHGYKEGAEE